MSEMSRDTIVEMYCNHIRAGGAGQVTEELSREEADELLETYGLAKGQPVFRITMPVICRVGYSKETGAKLLQHVGQNRWIGLGHFPESSAWGAGELEKDPTNLYPPEGP